MASNVLITPASSTIVFTDSSGVAHTITINGSTQDELIFTGSVASTLVIINDSTANTGTLNPGVNGLYLGSSTGNRWFLEATGGNFNRTLSLANPGGSNGAELNWASATAPTSPVTGDMWWDGTHLYFRNGSINLDIVGVVTNAFVQSGNSFGTGASIGTNDNNSLTIETNNTPRALFDTSGNFVVGNTTASARIQSYGGDMAVDSVGASNTASEPGRLTYINAGGNFGTRTSSSISAVQIYGRVINANPDLLDGLTGYVLYDNAAGGHTLMTVVADSVNLNAPNSSGNMLQIAYDGGGTPGTNPAPGFGGFRLGLLVGAGANGQITGFQYKRGSRIRHRIWANIPVGYSIGYGSNSYGTGGTFSWISNVAGTGNWYLYEAIQHVGETGSYGSTFFYYLQTGGANTAFNWYVAQVVLTDEDAAPAPSLAPNLNVGLYQGANQGWGDLLNTGNALLALTTTSKVGISVTSPAQRLDIGYGHLRFTQLAAPGAPTAATGAAGLLTGTYYYVVTFVTAQGETQVGTTSSSVAPSSQQVSLTAIPTDPLGIATSRKIYRTNFTANGSATTPLYLLTTIGDNTTTTYTDNTADGSLGTINFALKDNTTAGLLYSGTTLSGIFGGGNTGLGFGVLGSVIANGGYQNVALGVSALHALTTGNQNVAVGYQSMSLATGGIGNNALGVFTLGSLTNGTYNSAYGYISGNSLVSGSNNSFYGANSGRSVTSSNNTMLGFASGYTPNGVSNPTTSGANNTFVGYQAGQATSTQVNNTIAIGVNATVTSNNQAVIGAIGSTAAVNLGISNNNPAQRLDVGYGHLRFTQLAAPGAATVATGAAGILTGTYYYVVTLVTAQGETSVGSISASVAPSSQQVNLTAIPTDTLGFATSRKIYRTTTGGVSGGPFYLLTTIADNTTTTYTDNTADGSLGAVDYTFRENTTGGLIYVGTAISGLIGKYNTVIGQSAFASTLTSGQFNVGLGQSVLNANTSGLRNTAVGSGALSVNTSGSHNSAFGHGAMNGNTTGNFNSGVGEKILWENTTGQNNSAFGYIAGQFVVTGSQNTAIGSSALQNVMFGSGNIVLGYAADILSPTPGSMTATAASGSGLSTGVYQYFVTFVINSNETQPNLVIAYPVSVTTTSGNNQVNLATIPTYSGSWAATRKIYRTQVGGVVATSTFYLLTTISDNTTTVYTDSTPDGSLGAAYSATTNGSIVIGSNALAPYKGLLVIGSSNASVISDAYIGNGVYASSPQAITLHSTGGLGTDHAGANFIIAPGQGTGAGAGGYFSVQTAAAGTTGAIFNSLTERFRIDSTGLTSVKGSFNAGSSAQMTIDTSGNIGTSGGHTQTGTTANTFSGATTFSATGTAVSVTNNTTIGGTLTLTPMTSGSVLFAGTSGVLTQNNTYFFWDNTHNRLGLGPSAPAHMLSIADGNLQFQYVGNPGAPTVATGSAGVLTGNYYYRITYVTALGETRAGTVSALVAPSSQQVNLTAIPVSTNPDVTSKNIYRTATGGVTGGPFYLVANISAATTTYTDNTADGSLGTADVTNRDNTTSGGFYIGGTNAGFLGFTNVAFGYDCLASPGMSYANVVFGVGAGTVLTTGSNFNVLIGWGTAQSMTTGSGNVVMGQSLINATTTAQCVAIGHGAFQTGATNSGNQSVGVGYSVGAAATGANMVLVGHRSGNSLSSGAGNTFVGFQSGYSPGNNTSNATTTGGNNTFLGYQTGATSSTQFNLSIAIGYQAIVASGNQCAIGGTGGNAVKVGINNNNPSTAQLSLVTDAVGTIGILVNGAASQTANLQNWAVNGSVLTSISSSGSIGTSGGYTQTGTTANTFSGASTFSATGTALTINNNGTVSGLLGVGGGSSSGKQLNVATTATGNVGIYVNGMSSQTGDLQDWAVNGTTVASVNAAGNILATTTITINNTVGGYSVGFTTANSFNATQVYTLPSNYPGTNGLILASTTSGALSWVANTGSSSSATIGGAVTGGLDGYVLYINNNGGSTPILAQDVGMIYDYGNQTLNLAGTAANMWNLAVTKANITTTSTAGARIQNNTASTSGTTQQQSPALDFIGHAWNTTSTAADNYVRLRQELQVTSAATPTGLFVWKTSVDTGTASFSNVMTLTTGGALTVANGITITSGGFTVSSGTITFTGFSGVVKASGGTLSASAITNADLSGSAGITNANLANSSITVSAGTNISITGGGPVSLGGTVTISATGVFNWSTSVNTTSPVSAVVNTGYIANNSTAATAVVYNLPVPAVGALVEIVSIGNTGGFQAVASAGVTIQFGNVVGAAAGSATSTGPYDSIKLLGTSTTTWQIIGSDGTISIA